jgi:alpha-1,6-mannosyltransferase
MTVNAPLGATPEGGLDLTARARLVAQTHTLRHLRMRPRAERIGIAATLAVPLMGLLICIAGTRSTALAPQSIGLAPEVSGMTGPLGYIGFSIGVGGVVAALLVLLGVYLLALHYSEHVPPQLIIWSVAAFTVTAVLGPPLFSTDVFSYQAYAQLFVHYHINPYLHGPNAMGFYPLPNQLAQYIGAKWTGTPSVYGPLFTFLSLAFQATSFAFNYYAFKVIAALASVGTLYLLWRSAKLRGVSPARGVALVGLNPMVTLYGVGGGHNDLLMMMFTTAGIYTLLSRREGSAGVLLTAGAAVKLTGAIVLPFALLGGATGVNLGRGRRWHRLLVGSVVTAAVFAAASYLAFGTGILHLLKTLQGVQDLGYWQSAPGLVFSLAGLSVTHLVRIADDVVLGGTLVWLLRRVWQGRMDWLDGAAWATFAVLATAWYLLPWYTSWMLPLVALSSNRRVWNAAIAATLMGSAIMVAGCFPSWTWL